MSARPALSAIAMAGALAALASATQAPISIGAVVPDFTLRDQLDRTFRLAGRGDSLIVLICGDREGSRWLTAWGRAARAADSARATADSTRAAGRSRTPIIIRYIADLRGVPGVMHGYVRGKFKPAKNPVLLDWDGVMARIFGLTPRVANVFVIEPHGTLAYVTAGKAEPDQVATFREAMRRLLEPAGPAARP
jgi:hypothetical protein